MNNIALDNKSVLMVEDDINLLKLNTEILVRNGYTVHSAKNISEAKACLNSNNNISIAVLDIVLPDGDGLLLASEVKAKINCPVLMLTSKNAHEDIVKGMNSDADMYMTKPFIIPELIARIEGLLQKHQITANEKENLLYLTCGELKIDTIARQAFIQGLNLSLTPKDFTLLLVLARKENIAVPQEVLYEKVWGQTLISDTMALRSAIARLRKKLQNSDYTIRACRGKGYVFEKC